MGLQSDYFKIGRTSTVLLSGTGYNGSSQDLATDTSYSVIITANDVSNPPTAAGLILPPIAGNWAFVQNGCSTSIYAKLSVIDPNPVSIASGESALVFCANARYYKVTLGTVTLDINSYTATTSESGSSYLLIRNSDGNHYKILLSELTSYISNNATSLATPLKTPVSYLYTANVATSGAVANQDGITPAAGSLVLLVGQTTASTNGAWVTAAGAWTRPTWFAVGTSASGFIIEVKPLGYNSSATLWMCTSSSGSDVIGTNSLAFECISASFSILNGDVSTDLLSGVASTSARRTRVMSTTGNASGVLTGNESEISKTGVVFASRRQSAVTNYTEQVSQIITAGNRIKWEQIPANGGRESKVGTLSMSLDFGISNGTFGPYPMAFLDAYWNLMSGVMEVHIKSGSTGTTAGAAYHNTYYCDAVLAPTPRWEINGSTTPVTSWAQSSGTQPAWTATVTPVLTMSSGVCYISFVIGSHPVSGSSNLSITFRQTMVNTSLTLA